MKPVSVFLPCIVGQWLPDIGRAAFKLLCRAGCSPFYHRDQTCCGQMLFNAEHDSQAKKLAMRLIETFENDPVIVCPSGSCVQMVRVNYQLLFANEPKWQSRAQSLAARVFELSEFLVDQLGLTDLGAKFDGKVAYHESCSLLYGLGISEQPKALLKGVKGLELAHMQGADICCGFGGRFSMDYPEISSHIALIPEDKIVGSYEQAMAGLQARRAVCSQIVFITGPSMTADIQGRPFKGMHGPGKLIAVIV
jgi:L-lactate dehydrogenase complex protein LldE